MNCLNLNCRFNPASGNEGPPCEDCLKKLREATGAGFKDCSSALKDANGDIDKAIEILRIKGVQKRTDTQLLQFV